MSVTRSDLLGLYLSYFGRPADPGGVAFYGSDPSWDVWKVAAAFSASPESQSLYGTASDSSRVVAIYQRLFDRDPEPAGLQYWTGQVADGHLTPAGMAYAIFLGAQNADAGVVANRFALCSVFNLAVDTPAEVAAYAGEEAAARAREVIHRNDFYGLVTIPEAWNEWADQQVAYVTGIRSVLPSTLGGLNEPLPIA